MSKAECRAKRRDFDWSEKIAAVRFVLFSVFSMLFGISSVPFILCSLMFFIAGCASMQEYVAPQGPSDGQITVLLKGPDKTATDISFDLTAVNILAEDGTPREISSTPISIKSLALTGRQIRLGEKYIPEGRYKKLQLIVKQTLIKKKDKTANLALPARGIEIDIDVTVKRNENTSLFLNWDPDASVQPGVHR
jgi:hypothetical protein